MPRVLISDKLEAPGLDLLRQAGIELDKRPGLKGAALKEALRGRRRHRPQRHPAHRRLLEDPGKLRAIVRAGVGVDNIDVAAATRKGIVVMNTPGGNTVSTAEHTITLLMALARHIARRRRQPARQGKWERSKFVGTQLAGKTLGVVGLGRIGREVARRAAGLDMKVIGFDPFLAPDRAGQLGIESVPDLDAPAAALRFPHRPHAADGRDARPDRRRPNWRR